MGIRISKLPAIHYEYLLIAVLSSISTMSVAQPKAPERAAPLPLAQPPNQLPARCENEANWRSLFDGSSLQSWELHQHGFAKWIRKLQFWRANQALGGWHIDSEKNLARSHTAGDLRSKQQFANFALELEWKISSAGNSGVKLRVQDENNAPANNGFEMQILDNAEHSDGKRGVTSAGALYGLYAPTNLNSVRAAGEWNQALIVLDGPQVTFFLNGEQSVDAEIGSADWNQRLEDAPQRSRVSEQFALLPRGHIVLQDHTDPVWFRNIRICELAN